MWLFLTSFESLILASAIAASFVLSLYLCGATPLKILDRDRPEVIKQRIIATTCVTIGAFTLIYLIGLYHAHPNASDSRETVSSIGPPFPVWIGFPPQLSSYLSAFFLPILLTGSIFLGPIVVHLLTAMRSEDGDSFHPSIEKIIHYFSNGVSELFSPDEFWKSARNLFAAPLIEEFVFRSAIIIILLSGGYSFKACVFLSPFLFGAAHLHHLLNLVRSNGLSIAQGLLRVTFQLTYTTIFGSYASFIYLRTGHILAPIMAHIFCNMMGFPQLSFLSPYHFLYRRRMFILAIFVVGIVLFSLALFPLTEPSLYYPPGSTSFLSEFEANYFELFHKVSN